MIKEELKKKIENVKCRSTWSKGVKIYALELLENTEENELNEDTLKKTLLNGAENFKEFSWGGCSLIYNEDIATRLCNNSELKNTKNGVYKPNKNEEWLDTQARALYQAYIMIKENIKG